MAQTHKVLGQSNPSAATLTTLYTVPSSTSAIVSTLSVCNLGVSATFRIAVRPSGASISNQHYLVYDTTLNANDSFYLTLGLSLASTDVVSVYSSTNTVAFSLFGVELS
jgi:hypothetical protein